MSDTCIYTFRAGDIIAMIVLFVILAACNDTAWMQVLKAILGAKLKIKDLGDLGDLATTWHAYYPRQICMYYFDGPIEVREGHPCQAQHV
jgi:hypothetical protein